MVNFILIAFCIAAGMIFTATKSIHPDAHKSINTWILYIALPAVSFEYIPKIRWSEEMLLPAISSLIVWAGSWLFMEIYCRHKHYAQRTRSSLEIASGFANTSFIGFPLISAYFGEQYLSIAIICDQAMFVILSTAGIVAALKGGSQQNKPDARFILKRLVTFPPFIGCVSSLVLSHFINLQPTEPFFNKLAATVAPLALFSVGLQLKFKGWQQEIYQIGMSQIYKLLLAPVLVLILVLVLHLKGDIAKISVFEAAMPTLLTSSIIAEEYRLNARLTNLIIGISIIVGLATTALWYQIVQVFL
ncbi:transporter [Arachidicoccus ginsenosidimutans]|uniref:AEC family transporter n=1 Tax=Arachidicoccus sp. BS20 TaxID=1850526 RepID=UPI0007F095AA|nr:AEC family transporter [Arachidicoccus sp. BS20]ANI88728.1 transporter [Arachidicoccus sp. BS20]